MSDIQELRSQVNRAARIASFLDDEDIKDVIMSLTKQYRDAVMENIFDERSWHKHAALIDLVAELRSKVTSGEMAQQQLSQKR